MSTAITKICYSAPDYYQDRSLLVDSMMDNERMKYTTPFSARSYSFFLVYGGKPAAIAQQTRSLCRRSHHHQETGQPNQTSRQAAGQHVQEEGALCGQQGRTGDKYFTFKGKNGIKRKK